METREHRTYRDKHPDRVKASYDKWYARNRDSRLKRRRDRTPRHPRVVQSIETLQLKARLRARQYKYGITDADYRQRFVDQQGVCAACRQPETCITKHGTIRDLCVDHDHRTGRVRGLLCANCNFVLGHAHDDTRVLLALALYLENTNA